jgi:hypothetical protein
MLDRLLVLRFRFGGGLGRIVVEADAFFERCSACEHADR